MSKTVAELVEQIHEVSPLPAAARKVVQLCSCPTSVIDEIAEAVASDPALAAEVMRIASSGNVGIGTTSPGEALDVIGNIQYSGIAVDASDRRLKENLTPLDSDTIMERFAQIDTYSFTMKDDPTGQIEFGVIAQEIEGVFPELVTIADDEMKTRHDNYVGFIAPLIEATNELQEENAALQAQINEKEERLAAIEARMASFENDMAGVKMHTGYGILKASLMPALAILMLLFGGGFAIAIRRNDFNQAAGK